MTRSISMMVLMIFIKHEFGSLAIFERQHPIRSEVPLFILVSNLVVKFGTDERSSIVLSDCVKVLFGHLPRHMLPLKIVEHLDALPSVPLGVERVVERPDENED